jgi:uncharacterized protein (DUF3820 family)
VKVCTDRFLKMHGTSLQLHIFLIELEGSGLVAAVFPSGTQGAPISLLKNRYRLEMPTQPCSPWRMNRPELLVALDALQIPVHPRWTVPELRQTLIEQTRVEVDSTPAALKGLSKLNLADLKTRCEEEGITIPEKPTRGLMIKLLREKVQPAGEQVVPFGKYKSWMYKEIPEAYLHWAIKETNANSNSSPDLVKLANWAKEDLEKRATQARVAGAVPMAEDPEVRAKHPPPPVSSAGSSASWSLMSAGGYTTQRGRGTPFPKRDAATMDAARMAEMDMELPEEAQAEMLRLETEMAVIRQKYNKAKDYSQ